MHLLWPAALAFVRPKALPQFVVIVVVVVVVVGKLNSKGSYN